MDIPLKRFDTSLPVPEYKSKGAAGIDLYIRTDLVIKAGEITYAPLNIAVEIPNGYAGLVLARSSLHKSGLMLANNVGVIDSDYSGDNDEWLAALYNFTKEDVSIEKGMRIAQVVIIPVPQIHFMEVAFLGNEDRGGYGSTGTI